MALVFVVLTFWNISGSFGSCFFASNTVYENIFAGFVCGLQKLFGSFWFLLFSAFAVNLRKGRFEFYGFCLLASESLKFNSLFYFFPFKSKARIFT